MNPWRFPKGLKWNWFVLAVLAPASIYVWTYGYYRRLYLSGQLLSAAQATAETLPAVLVQHSAANLPDILFLAAALAFGSGTAKKIGLTVKERKTGALPLALGAYFFALPAALQFADAEPLAIYYQWVYFLVFVAFLEEAVFRGLLPYWIEKAGLSERAVWVVPGVLFAVMHTLVPTVRNGFSMWVFLAQTLSMLLGYTAGHLGFYALRRRSGTLWLPVLVHGFLDFLSVF